MTPSINSVLDTMRKRLVAENVAWGPESRTDPTNLSTSKPGEGGAENATDIPDALDKYLAGIAGQLVAHYGKSKDGALSAIMKTARSLASDGTLPSMPSDSADDAEIALWLGKAASIGFAQLVFQDQTD